MSSHFENRLIIPNDILKLIFSHIASFQKVYLHIRPVCRRWRRVVVEMMHTNREQWLLPWLRSLCDFLCITKLAHRNFCGGTSESSYNVLCNYLARTATETNGFNMNTGYARKCRCGLIMVFSACPVCKQIKCKCNIWSRLSTTLEVTCTNLACCFKQQFALTFGMCLCRNDVHWKNVMHVDEFFEKLKNEC